MQSVSNARRRRMKRSSADRGGGTSRQNASDRQKRAEQSRADPRNGENEPSQKMELRSRYRELISTVQQNREDILSPCNNKLAEVLEEADKLFKDVREVREAALDAHFLVVATDLVKEKATQMFASSDFDPSIFAEHLLSFMGLNRLEDEEEEQQNGQALGGCLPQDAWHRLARRAESCFRTAPSFRYMNGAFHVEPPPPKARTERQWKTSTKEVKRVIPTQLKKLEGSHEEATEKEVERILGYLRCYHSDDATSPISYYEFVIDPNSFSRTVENIFHTSFLVRDGLARVYLDDFKLPCIEPLEEEAMEDGDSSSRKQCIISFSPKMWKELVDAFEIRNAMIHPPDQDYYR